MPSLRAGRGGRFSLVPKRPSHHLAPSPACKFHASRGCHTVPHKNGAQRPRDGGTTIASPPIMTGDTMVKIIIAFVVVAGAAFYLLSKGGGDVSMGGEQHGTETHAPAAPSQK
uniref:Uncharacterized protein n=2 Tax=Cupriavidus pinatubonensis TaxID=248026 RepID=Q46YT9_CUPPJ